MPTRVEDGERFVKTVSLPPSPPGDLAAHVGDWLAIEEQAYAEVEREFDHGKVRAPDHWDINTIDAYMREKFGVGFGVWTTKPNGGKAIAFQTERDFVNLNVLTAHFHDIIANMDHYLKWRKSRLGLLRRYANDRIKTITEFDIMDDQINKHAEATMPNNENLAGIAKTVVAEAKRRPDQIHELVGKVSEAREALFAAMADIGTTFHTFKESTDNIAKELHAFRSSVVTDLSKAKSEMEDVRKFFLSKDHVTEIDRLREFITLCEQLKALKDSGFLDAVADTILKLEGS